MADKEPPRWPMPVHLVCGILSRRLRAANLPKPEARAQPLIGGDWDVA